jgi:pimeloyl-ACP methyl ester carboxylesterase
MDRSSSMVRLSRQLDEDHRVLRYDRRGYGRSKPHPGPFTIDGNVADLVALLAGRPAVLFGHSYGGNVALATAARHPGLVRAVAVHETPLPWLEWWPGVSRRAGTSTQPAEVAVERFMRRMVGDEAWERLPESVQEERRAEGVTFIGELTDLCTDPPWQPEGLRATGVPIVAMYGEHTADHHRLGVEFVAEQVAAGVPVAIAEAGHNAPYSHPAPVAEVLRRLSAPPPNVLNGD